VRRRGAISAIASAMVASSLACASAPPRPAPPRAAGPTDLAACDAGNAEACVRAARALSPGPPAAEGDWATVFRLYERACALGAEEGCLGLVDLYGHGRGVGKDERRAFALTRESCERGYPQGCADEGTLLLLGVFTQKDEAAARALCFEGPLAARARWCETFAAAVLQGTAGGGAARMGEAYERACAGGRGNSACLGAGLGLFQAGRRTEGLARVQRLCDGGDPPGCHLVGEFHRILEMEARGGAAPGASPAPLHLEVPGEKLAYHPPEGVWGTFVPTHGGPDQTIWRWWSGSTQIEIATTESAPLAGLAVEPLARWTLSQLGADGPVSTSWETLTGRPAMHAWSPAQSGGRTDLFLLLQANRAKGTLYSLLVIQHDPFDPRLLERIKAGLKIGQTEK
jgi:hypothetical protein